MANGDKGIAAIVSASVMMAIRFLGLLAMIVLAKGHRHSP
jgi:hypothetical protein